MGLEHDVHTGSCKDLDMGFEAQHTNLCLPEPSYRLILLLSVSRVQE
jgi:hypothetical protein